MGMKPSPVIYHGPSAETASQSAGRLVCPVFGTKKEDAKEFVSMAMTSFPGDNNVIVLGPLDDVLPGTMDVLLKTLEENPPLGPAMVLWCRDLGSVSKTIRSRCLDRWCPGVEIQNPQVQRDGSLVMTSAMSGRWFKVVELVNANKDDLRLLLMAMVSELSKKDDIRKRFWLSLREISGMKTLTPSMLVGALMQNP